MNTGMHVGVLVSRARRELAKWLLSFDGPVRGNGKPNFARADAHALEAPTTATASVKALGKYLAEMPSEAMRARAIFRWITANISYDVAMLRSGHISNQSPDDTLRSRMGVCQHYAELFEALAQVAGLRAFLISGDARVGGQMPGGAGDDIGHAWNAVRINGFWRLLDATWGAGAVDEGWRFTKRFSSYYFLTPPDRLLYTHYPRDPEWQLTRNRISRSEFDARPVLSGQWFEYGLELEEPNRNHTITNGPVLVRIKAPPLILMRAQLISQGGRVRCAGMEEWTGRGDLQFNLPRKGDYILQLLARRGPMLPGVNLFQGVLQLMLSCR